MKRSGLPVPLLLLFVCIVCLNQGSCRAFQASTFPIVPPSSPLVVTTKDDDGRRNKKADRDGDGASSGITKRTRSDHAEKQQPQQQQQQNVDEWIATAQDQLAAYFPFPLDDWQLYAGGAICNGYNVVVSAPTGAG
jgi:superfamily II RNA helicase